MFGGMSAGTSGPGSSVGSGGALGTAADNPVCQKLINRSPPENGQLNCQEIVRVRSAQSTQILRVG